MIGDGGHADVVIALAQACNREIIGFTSKETVARSFAGEVAFLGNDTVITDYSINAIELTIGVGSSDVPSLRNHIYRHWSTMGYRFATLIHPSATTCGNVKFGEGAQVLAHAVVQTKSRIGNNTILNTASVVEHHCVVGDGVHIATRAACCGGVKIGDVSHIGAGAIIIQGVEIGERSLVAAGAVVVRNVPPGKRVRGVPARCFQSH